MNERVLRVLEFDKIIDRLGQHASTTIGKEKIQLTKPLTNVEQVNQALQETDEAVQLIRLNLTIPFGGIVDIRNIVERSHIGSVLTAEECLQVASTIYGVKQVRRFFDNLEEPLERLNPLAEQLQPLHELEKEILRCIDEHAEILDQASTTLRSIRSTIRTLEQRIRGQLETMIRTKSQWLSDGIMTIRNDRFVLPVKHEHRSQVGGVVHDQSASGQTLFMEPRAVVEYNNKLQEARAKERQEIERILRHLSRLIAKHHHTLKQNVEIIGEIDFIHARARLAREMDAVLPKMNNDGLISMRKARHPLIPDDEVVPNDFEIGKDYTAIVITGPNTGGKTVTLKMVGLCTLMAQSGLHVPAMDGCELSVFKEVHAVIGDEQSIEQNLSTFSAHMSNIVQIMKQVDEHSLVLFDELGSGTDPQEGAALAMAILDEVVSRQARVIATTHYPELKAYGYNQEHVVNASVEFNIQTLQPTYRLLIGVPGRSNAFDISKRLGLDEAIIHQAKKRIGVETTKVENMILSLETAREKAEKDYEKAHQIVLESLEIHEALITQWREFQKRKETLYQAAEEKAEKALQAAKNEAEQIVSDIRKMKTNFKEHEWIEAKKGFEDASLDLTKESAQEVEDIAPSSHPIRVGDEIQLLSINQRGTVIEKQSDDTYVVQIGMMKVTVKETDIKRIDKPKKKNIEPMPMIRRSNTHVKPELDLRGERYEDALAKLEKYLDEALLANFDQVTIIHGKGTGALRKGVQSFVKSHPRIASFREGVQGEGGSGVTVLQLK